MPQLGFEPTIPAFKQTRTVHGLDRAAPVIGLLFSLTRTLDLSETRSRIVLPL
jgi:hypothetical protein